MSLVRSLAIIGICAVTVCGQSINIDLNAPAGAGSGAPAATFGAAAAQPGTWNAVATGNALVIPLVNLAGAATSATIQRNGSFNYFFQNAQTTGDTELLMDDLDDPSPGTTYNFAGLTPGKYRVYTYAWAPDNAIFLTNVSVTGSTNPTQTVGGAMAPANTLTQGITHAIHDVVTSTGTITVVVATAPAGSFSSVNGFQFVRCPTGFDFKLSQAGAGANLDFAFTCGTPGDFYFAGLNLVAGAFPNGPFYGIEFDPVLVNFEFLYGPPLFGILDANGNAFGSFPGPIPSLLPVYAVGITANPAVTIISSTTPFIYTTL